MPNWWDDEKIFFACQKCGKCCERKGVLMFNDADITKASAYLEMKEDVFKKTYLRYDKGYYFILNSRKSPCPFLLKNECRIHDAKPLQCKTYPFWPQIVKDKITWRMEKVHCKGIGIGKEINMSDIVPDNKVLADATEQQMAVAMALASCEENHIIGDDGKCRSKGCFASKDPIVGERIKNEGCILYKAFEAKDESK